MGSGIEQSALHEGCFSFVSLHSVSEEELLIEADPAGQVQPVPKPPSNGRNYAYCVEIVDGIRAGRAESMEAFYRILMASPRGFLASQIPGQDIEDRLHETFRLVVSAIRRGEMRDPERLMGFVYVVLKRQVMLQIGQLIIGRRMKNIEEGWHVPSTVNLEATASLDQRLRFTAQILNEMPEVERAVLVDFYLSEKPAKQICEELGLTDTRFRLLKWKAKRRLGKLGRRGLLTGRLSTLKAQRINEARSRKPGRDEDARSKVVIHFMSDQQGPLGPSAACSVAREQQ